MTSRSLVGEQLDTWGVKPPCCWWVLARESGTEKAPDTAAKQPEDP